MSEPKDRPFRILWESWDDRIKNRVTQIYYKHFETSEEACKFMLELAEKSTWSECEFRVVEFTAFTAAGRNIR